MYPFRRSQSKRPISASPARSSASSTQSRKRDREHDTNSTGSEPDDAYEECEPHSEQPTAGPVRVAVPLAYPQLEATTVPKYVVKPFSDPNAVSSSPLYREIDSQVRSGMTAAPQFEAPRRRHLLLVECVAFSNRIDRTLFACLVHYNATLVHPQLPEELYFVHFKV